MARLADETLRALAINAGLQPHWQHVDGTRHEVSVETLRAALRALGIPCDSPAECDASERMLADHSRWSFLTVDCGRDIPLSGRLTLESGEARDVVEGFTIAEPGYHRLKSGDRMVTLAAAPARAPDIMELTGRQKAWGIAAQLYSLRGTHAAGFGDAAALEVLARSAASAGAQAVAISPVHALFTAEPARCSPYSPSSRDAFNPLYAVPHSGSEPDSAALIDWPHASAERFARLRADFDAFAGDPAFDLFASDRDITEHALFEALSAHLAQSGSPGGCSTWPVVFQNPESSEVAAFAAEHRDEIRFHLFLQWRAFADLRAVQASVKAAGMGIGLIADLAVGLDPQGSHAWSRPSELLTGLTIGAPPDAFQANGQGWGITGFSPRALAELGFAPFLRTIRHALSFAGGVRVDHALGLERLWIIPDGAEPRDGVYLRQPFDDLTRLLALEAYRHRALVIAEDLGTVPDGFRDKMVARHLLGMRVLTFEREADGGFVDPAQWTPAAVAMTSTHDLIPIAGWWSGTDIRWREKLGISGEDEADRSADRALFWPRDEDRPGPDEPAPAVDEAIERVAEASCDLAIVAIEDLLGLAEAPNMPGTIDQHPNWRRRLPIADIFSDPAATRRAAILREERP